MQEADVILLWGSNARDTHPIFFHHVLKALRRGARLYVVDPRQTASAKWADAWLPVHVGADTQLARAMAHVILAEGLENRVFIDRATAGFAAFEKDAAAYHLVQAEKDTGVPADLIRRVALDYARADRAQLCWTLGITEHHNAVDNVLSLINLALLTGHVGRWGSGLSPLRGQNNVQGGGDMGALPHKLPGFQDVDDAALRAPFDAAWGVPVPPWPGWHLSDMIRAMDRGELTALYVLGENPAQSEADVGHVRGLLRKLPCLIVQDIFLTRTAEMADVVLPATVSWCESEGTVTSSERRVQRVRRAVPPPAGPRDDIAILCDLSRRLGHDIGDPTPKEAWDELRCLSPMHGGMSYSRLESLQGIQWPCPDEESPGAPFLHGRLWEEPLKGPPAPFHVIADSPPVDPLDDRFPLRLTTGRHLESFNTGVQTDAYTSPLRRRATLDLSPQDAARYDVAEGERVRVCSRRGAVTAPVRLDRALPPGLAFMAMHFPDQVDSNLLTIDAVDPKSGTAEFKAAAIRIEKLKLGSNDAPLRGAP